MGSAEHAFSFTPLAERIRAAAEDLTIARRVVAQRGGLLWFEGELGKGRESSPRAASRSVTCDVG